MEPGPENLDGVDFDLATTGARLGARAIDTFIGLVVIMITLIVVLGMSDAEIEPDTELDLTSGERLIVSLLPILFWALYEVILIRRRGQTIGKMAMKIRVIGTSADEPPTWNSAVMRWAVLALPYALLPDQIGLVAMLIIGLWFVWDAKRQGLHDKAANTYVVKAHSSATFGP